MRKDLAPATVAVMFPGLIQPAAILCQMSLGELISRSTPSARGRYSLTQSGKIDRRS